MDTITYVTETFTKVYLAGKHVGTITHFSDCCFFYTPKGQNRRGDTYPTLAACKASLEE